MWFIGVYSFDFPFVCLRTVIAKGQSRGRATGPVCVRTCTCVLGAIERTRSRRMGQDQLLGGEGIKCQRTEPGFRFVGSEES